MCSKPKVWANFLYLPDKLWAVVCKAVKRNPVVCEVGFSEIDDGG